MTAVPPFLAIGSAFVALMFQPLKGNDSRAACTTWSDPVYGEWVQPLKGNDSRASKSFVGLPLSYLKRIVTAMSRVDMYKFLLL